MVPTTRPRYTVTDTGALRQTLDRAQKRWPDIDDRRQLLLALVDLGRDVIAQQDTANHHRERGERQIEALGRAGELVDPEVLLADAAWR